MKRYAIFDWLRLLLASEVVYLHISHCFKAVPVWPPRLFSYVPAVALFVLLSGFLIPGSFETSNGWGHFAWKRFLRVMPAFATSLVICAAVFGPKMIWPILVTYLTAGFISAGANGPVWSLMVEEVLYGFHALGRKTKFLWSQRAAIWCLVGTAFVWLLLRRWMDVRLFNPGADPDQHLAPVFAFFLGNVLSFHKDRILKWLPALPAIPDLSYGVYIYHFPILMWCVYFQKLPQNASIAVTVLGTLTVSMLSWYFVEKPALKLKNNVPVLRRARVPAVAAETAA